MPKKVITDDDRLLKKIVIENLRPWMAVNPDVRNQAYVAQRCPHTNPTLISRCLDEGKTNDCPSLIEAIEMLSLANVTDALDEFMKRSPSVSASYLRSLRNGSKST